MEATKENDLIMDFAIGPNQGTGVPAPADSDGLMWDIVMSNVSVELGGTFDATLPGWGSGTLLAAITGLETNSTVVESSNKLQPDQYGLPGDYFLSRTQISLSSASLRDVTEQVSSKGHLTVDFSSDATTGLQHNIFAVYIKKSGYRAQAGPGSVEGSQSDPKSWIQNGSWAVDHFSALGAKTTTDFWEQYILQNGTRELLMEVGNYAWEDSIEIGAKVYWTQNLTTAFTNDHGYSITKWLPILYHRNGKSFNPSTWWVTDEDDGGNSHIADYRATLTGLYHDYLSALNDWAQRYLNLTMSAQVSYNLPMDMLANIPDVGAPETESLDFSDLIDGYRQYSGPANLAGRRIVSSECGAVKGEGVSQTLPELLWHVKRSYVGSVNQFVFHGFPYSGYYGNTTWPGFTTFTYQYSTMHGPYQPAWEFYGDQMDFVARNNFVLQSGAALFDLAFWQKKTVYPGHVELRTYEPKDLERAGYTYQYLSPDNLDLTSVKDGVLAPDSQNFKALVVRANDSLTVDGVAKLVEFGRAGLPILFAGGTPTEYVGSYSSDDIQKSNEGIQSLLSLSNVHSTDTWEILSAVEAAGIEPRTRISTNASWYTYWRSDSENDIDYIYVYNDAPRTIQGKGLSEGTIEFQSVGIPYEYNAWTGEQRPILAYQQTSNTTIIPLRLVGNQSTIVAFRAEGTGSAERPVHLQTSNSSILGYSVDNSSLILKMESQSTTASGSASCEKFTLANWTLTVEHWKSPSDPYNYTGGAAKHNTTHQLPSLVAWKSISSVLQNVSGIGYYNTTFEWPPASCSSGDAAADGALIDFGFVYHTLRAAVNGHRLPPLDVAKPVADLQGFLRNGTNRVDAVVATPLGNALRPIWRQLESSGEGPGSSDASSIDPPPLKGYGLLEDVEITPYRLVTVQ